MISTHHIKKINQDRAEETEDQLAVEEPLEIQLEFEKEGVIISKGLSVTMRTPGQDKELAAGFLLTEGIIQNGKQIKSIRVDQNKVLVKLKEDVSPYLQNSDRNFYTTSSCGVCGKASIDAIRTASVYQQLGSDLILLPEVIYSLPAQLRENQKVFDNTGGLHAAGLFNLQGKLIFLREDVGRHNAMDKIVGAALIKEMMPLTNTILLLSGRASFELLQKASMAGIKVVAAVGAPSSLAVQLAEEFDITLIGFLREKRFNIYSGAARVKV